MTAEEDLLQIQVLRNQVLTLLGHLLNRLTHESEEYEICAQANERITRYFNLTQSILNPDKEYSQL